MTPKCFMLIAGEASGDLLASELVAALREAVAGGDIYRGWRSQNVGCRSRTGL